MAPMSGAPLQTFRANLAQSHFGSRLRVSHDQEVEAARSVDSTPSGPRSPKVVVASTPIQA
eukprot:3824963-Lingulodinium_polyedra.AAC.1